MRIIIKAKDYSIVDVENVGTVLLPDDNDASMEALGIAKIVAKAFLYDVENDSYKKDNYKYIDFVQPVYKQDGQTIDNDKRKIILRESEGLRIRGVVGVLRNKSFNPMINHGDVIRECLDLSDREGSNSSENRERDNVYEKYNKSFDVTLQIGSRFDSDDRQFFLETMFVDEKYEMETKKNDVLSNEESVLDFLVLFLFRQQLSEAYENGPYKKYVRYERNDSRLKGSIDVARHIKLNAGLNNGRVAYSYRDYTADNNITHLIVHAFEHAKKYFPGYSYSLFFDGDNPVSRIISELRTMAPSVEGTNEKEVIAQSGKIIDHPYYYKYEALRKTCLMILRFDGMSMFDGSDDDIQGILFYIPTLWENFLERQFEKRLGLPYRNRVVSQDVDANHWVYVAKEREKGSYQAKPDFVIYADDLKQKPLVVLDAKFKPKWAAGYGGTSLPDHEDFDKCLRDMCANRTRSVGVIFPYMTNDDLKGRNHYEYGISKYNDLNMFFTIPVKVPDSSADEYKNYSSWISKFEDNINTMIKELIVILESEQDEQKRRLVFYQKLMRYKELEPSERSYLAKILGVVDGVVDKEQMAYSVHE